MGGYDFIYGGDVSKWVKFAKGLQARYKLRWAGSDNAAYSEIVSLVDSSFASAADQASMQYDGSNQNPMFDFQWSRDYISSSTSLYNKLMDRNDPRAERVYFDPGSWEHYTSETVVPLSAKNGDPVESQYVFAYDVFAFGEVAPVHFLSYHELQFIKAEALARQGKTADAKAALKKAVEAAFANLEVNVKGAMGSPSINGYGGLEDISGDALSAADADAYFENSVSPLFDANPLKEIMLQKYIALWGANGEAAYKNAGNYVFTDNVRWAGGSN